MRKKRKKIIIAIVVVVVIIILVVIGLALNLGDGKEENETTDETKVTTVIGDATSDNDSGDTDDNPWFSDDDDEELSGDDSTNFFDNVDVYEDAGSNETMTDEDGNEITEAYPGEQDGWSPIVSPEELNN